MCNPMPYYAGKLCAQVVGFFSIMYILLFPLCFILCTKFIYLFIYFLIKAGNFLCEIMF